MKEKTGCFTGHRVIPQHEYERIEQALRREIIRLIVAGYCHFGVGGAFGFDMLECV